MPRGCCSRSTMKRAYQVGQSGSGRPSPRSYSPCATSASRSASASSSAVIAIAPPLLHPEDAEGALGNGGVEGGGDPEREHAARVARVDDPVVPEARRRVVRVALGLVGGADRVR